MLSLEAAIEKIKQLPPEEQQEVFKIIEFIDFKNQTIGGSKTIKSFKTLNFKEVFFKYENTNKNIINRVNFKLRMFVAILCMIIAALCTGFHAWLVKPALDNVLINADRFYLYFIPIAILITGIIKGLVTYIQITSLQFMSHRIIENSDVMFLKI